eukprot:TRINITY_DN9684_c0_g1_i1.p1 TRINITY_DN9684_c0_g1~~TRINITY_DN9684_c0_g1_i1.p1  ORF type:complete len:181 (-),score=34.08 TRINITY_DN9684_c0_g1_i1:349-891(-)
MDDKPDLHKKGECKPCAYFHKKEDGCRQGDDCPFCHLCPPGEIIVRKKEKLLCMRAARKHATQMSKRRHREEKQQQQQQQRQQQQQHFGYESNMGPASQEPYHCSAAHRSSMSSMGVHRGSMKGKSHSDSIQEPSKDRCTWKIEAPPGLHLSSLSEILQIHGLPLTPACPSPIRSENATQ